MKRVEVPMDINVGANVGGIGSVRTRGTGMKLDVTVGTRMLLSFSGTDTRHGTELVGLVPYEYLILKMPLVPGIRSRLQPGEGVTVRCMQQGTIIGFRTHVITQITKPGALVFVEFPAVLEQYELRSHKRLRCLIPADVHCSHGRYRAAIIDLSVGGCKLCFEVKASDPLRGLEALDMLVLRANLFAGEESTLSCLCRNVEVDKSTLIAGVSFTDMDSEGSLRLQEYIETVSSFL